MFVISNVLRYMYMQVISMTTLHKKLVTHVECSKVHVHVHVNHFNDHFAQKASDTCILIIRLVIGHYWPLILVSVLSNITDIVISVLIMSFLVILISFKALYIIILRSPFCECQISFQSITIHYTLHYSTYKVIRK